MLYSYGPDIDMNWQRGLPLITYAPRGREGQVSYTFLLRITCKKKRGGGVQVACKNAYVINGRPQTAMQLWMQHRHELTKCYAAIDET